MWFVVWMGWYRLPVRSRDLSLPSDQAQRKESLSRSTLART
jgi:hypothetical protein